RIAALREPITTSIGVATMIGADISPTALIDRADKALYKAKTQGRDQIVQWDIHSGASVETDNIYGLKNVAPRQMEKTPEELQAGLRNALQNDDLCLYFQPIIDLDSRKVRSMEVLLRFESEELQGCSVEKLIAIAEQSGQIIEIGHWVMETAIAQYQHWTNTLGEQPKMAVNYSAFQISDRNASEQIINLIRDKMADPSKLEIEITESAIIKDISEAKVVLQQLRDLGVRIVLDDFGTGYSSLKYISEFQPDCVKMDQYFLKNFDRNNSDQRLVAAIITMAKNLNIDIVAEGIETTSQLRNIMSLKCDYGQGYLFSKPMPANIMPEWLALFSKNEPFPVELLNEKLAG
ncbi:MAG: EAL domain-containing protein, partial [bacterium]|nr:EAL domain-containing protein [bacterium]